jgi:hypothetical protein
VGGTYSGLLFEVAAILTASLSVSGAGMASGVHEYAPTAIHEIVSAQQSDRPRDIAAMRIDAGSASAAGDVDVDSLKRVSGANLLNGLSRLTSTEISSFVARYPGQIDAVLAAPPAAEQVTGWWAGLPAETRTSLTASAPRLVGNLEGISLRDRGRANLGYLATSTAEVKTELGSTKTGNARDVLTRKLAVLNQIDDAVTSRGTGGPVRSLVVLDTSGGGRAAIALGDPDTADYVSYLVPGMNYNVHDQIVNWSATAEALYLEQRKVLKSLRANNPLAGRGSVATIAWIGYEPPDVFSVGGLDRAEKGADFLEASWQGLRESRGSDQPFLSVFAHSYGSTVTLTALARDSVTLDALVMVGSPGSAIQSAAELPVANSAVYVGEADWDPAVNSAFFGSDPGGVAYGAHPLGVTGSTDRLTGASLQGSLGHNEYFKAGSESLHNMALIGTGNARLVTNGSE